MGLAAPTAADSSLELPLLLSISFFQGLLLILAAPGVVGLLRWFKARMQRRRGPDIRQPYFDLEKLLRRPAVRSEKTSWIFAQAPKVLFVVHGSLVFMLPVFHEATLITADLITVIYVLALGRFVLCLAGLDSGTGFGAMGSGREMFFQFLTEIGLIMVVAALMIQWNTADLGELLFHHRDLAFWGLLARPELMLLGLALALLVIMESGRIPIDNPASHLELTMAQRAIALEYAGRDLALIEWAEMIKMFVLLALLGGLFLPLPGLSIPVNGTDWGLIGLALVGVAVKIVVLLFLLAIWELAQPKLRLRAADRLGLVAIVLSLITILYSVIGTR
jgi:formate hydrogenlyase subunit 4